MLPGDIIVIAALAIFAIALVWRAAPARGALLNVSALTALATGMYGVFDDRWQAGAGAAVAALFLVALWGSRRRRPASRIWHVAALTLSAIGIAALLLFPVAPLPQPTGPYAVGVRSFALTDVSRRGLLGVDADTPRRLLVRVWYPAQPAGATTVPYFDDAEARSTARGFGDLIGFPPLLTYLKHVRTNSFDAAPLAVVDAALPVVFFSHGYIAYAQGNAVLMEALASHGYVVYSVQHSGDASPTVFPDGTVVPTDPAQIAHMHHAFEHGLPEAMRIGFTADDLDARVDGQIDTATTLTPLQTRGYRISAPVWLADRLFVHDRLQAGDVPANVSDIVAASDFTRTGEMGLSFGGSTASAVCMVDSRCAAAVNLDGGDFHLAGLDSDIPVPLLMFHADLTGFYRMFGVEPPARMRSFNDFSYERFEHAGTRDDVYRLILKDSVHAGLSDSPLFLRRPLRDSLFGTTPLDILIHAPVDAVLGFFDRHLRGQDNGFPQPQLEHYAGWLSRYDNGDVRNWWLSKTDVERNALAQRIDAARRSLKGEHHP